MKIEKIIKKVLVEEGAHAHEKTKQILQQLKRIPIKVVSKDAEQRRESLNMDKKTLRLLPFRGSFLKPCPGTKGYICCGYRILHIGTNCPLDCSYCILQAYFNQPSLRVYVNFEDALNGIAGILDSQLAKIFRVGTGEFMDSLALDPITGWSHTLTRFFHDKQNAVLEFKTKTDQIQGLLSSPHRNRIIVSWSLNSDKIAAREEHGAPSIKKRLLSAKRCQEEGYILGFHFDPLIFYANWRDDYTKTIELMDRYINPKGIIWISLGCFRYMPLLKTIIKRRHAETRVLDGEFIKGLDGKKRYFKSIRMEMYAFLRELMEIWYKDPGLYLCMESDEVWQKSFGWSPRNTNGLTHYLDQRVQLFFK